MFTLLAQALCEQCGVVSRPAESAACRAYKGAWPSKPHHAPVKPDTDVGIGARRARLALARKQAATPSGVEALPAFRASSALHTLTETEPAASRQVMDTGDACADHAQTRHTRCRCDPSAVIIGAASGALQALLAP